MSMHCNIFNHQGENYEIVSEINSSVFMESNGGINQKILGMYVHNLKANRVVQQHNKLIILKEIEDAIIED